MYWKDATASRPDLSSAFRRKEAPSDVQHIVRVTSSAFLLCWTSVAGGCIIYAFSTKLCVCSRRHCSFGAMFLTCYHDGISRFRLANNMHILLTHRILLTQIKTESETQCGIRVKFSSFRRQAHRAFKWANTESKRRITAAMQCNWTCDLRQ